MKTVVYARRTHHLRRYRWILACEDRQYLQALTRSLVDRPWNPRVWPWPWSYLQTTVTQTAFKEIQRLARQPGSGLEIVYC